MAPLMPTFVLRPTRGYGLPPAPVTSIDLDTILQAAADMLLGEDIEAVEIAYEEDDEDS